MNEADKKRGFFEKLKKNYRLSIVNSDTFEEISNFRFNILSIIFTLIGGIFLFSIFLFFVISYTPIRYYIPGYGSITSDKTYMEMKKRLDEMEEYIEDVNLYTDNMKKMLTDDVEGIENVELGDNSVAQNTKKVERIPEDDILRSKIDINQDLIKISQNLDSPIPDPQNIDQLFLIPPVKGIISAPYDESKNHFGIDIIASKNQTVKAVASGVVIIAENSLETGKTIGIQHPNDLVTYYKHNSTLLKKLGDEVKEGEAIAIIGNTGVLTSGPHLHFEMWYRGESLNPARYIETIK